MKYLSLVLIALAAINSSIGSILIKKSQEEKSFFLSLISSQFIAGCFFYGINLLLFAYSLKYIEVSKAYPIFAGLGFIFLSIGGFFILDETIKPIHILGLSLIVFGIYFLVK